MYSYLVEYNEKIIGSYSDFLSAKTFILSCLQNNFMKDFALVHQIMANSCYKIKTKKITLDTKSNYFKSMLSNKCKSDGFTCANTFSNSDSSSELSYESDSDISSSACTTSDSNFTSKTKSTITESTPKANTSPSNTIPNKSFQIDYSNPVVLEMAKQRIDLQHKINLMKKQKEKMEESKNVYENDLKLFMMFKASKDTNPSFEVPELFTKKYEIMNKLFLSNQLTWENFIKNHQQDNYYGDYFTSNSYEDMFVASTDTSEKSDTISEEFNINTDSD